MIKELNTEICIIGAGPAGYVAAITTAKLGKNVILVEKADIGGTCLNWGCIPTKALLKTAETIENIKKSNEVGLEAYISSITVSKAVARKDKIVKILKTGLEYLLNSPQITIIRGEAFIEAPNKIKVKTNDEEIVVSSDKLIITSGSKALKPSIPGIDLEGVITSNEATNIAEIPTSMTIIGAGAIGLEFATLFNALGTKITVIELMDRILPQEDIEITTELLKIMKRQGIKFKIGTKVKEIKTNETELITVIEENGLESEIISEKVLVAIGRELNITEDIKALGLKINEKAQGGGIFINKFMETSIKNIYAAGDIVGGKLLAHLAYSEGRVAAENACLKQSTINYNAIPSCVYTHPEVVSVGINEAEALNQGYSIKIGRFDFRSNGRSLSQGSREGFVKVVVDEASGVILGAQILGYQASELISEITLAITLKAKAEVLADMIHPHPTLSEAVMEACADALGIAIHK